MGLLWRSVGRGGNDFRAFVRFVCRLDCGRGAGWHYFVKAASAHLRWRSTCLNFKGMGVGAGGTPFRASRSTPAPPMCWCFVGQMPSLAFRCGPRPLPSSGGGQAPRLPPPSLEVVECVGCARRSRMRTLRLGFGVFSVPTVQGRDLGEHYLLDFRRLCSTHSNWQFSATVLPPSTQGVMWSASISSISQWVFSRCSFTQCGQMPPWRS